MAELEPERPNDRVAADELRWLERFVLLAAAISAGAALAGWLIARLTGMPPGPEEVILPFGLLLALVLVGAYLAFRHGRPFLGAAVLAALIVCTTITIALVIPARFAQPAIVPLGGLVLARQFVRGRALRAVAAACWLLAVGAGVIVDARSPAGIGWAELVFGVLPMGTTLALLFVVLTVFAERTEDALADERAAIDARATAVEELDASRRYAGQVTEAVPGIVLVYEIATGALTFGNANARRFVDDPMAPGALTMTGIIERAVHPDDGEAMQAWRLELGSAADDEIRIATARLLTPDGWRWHDIRGKVFRRAPDGSPIHVLAVALDATSERTATLQRDRFFDLAGDAFVVVGQDARIIDASPSLAPMLGVAPGQVIGMSMRESGHPDDHEVAAGLMRRLAHGEPRGTMVLRSRNAAGEWRAIEWTLAIDPDDLLMYGAARDITERLATRDALEKVRRLETVGRLAGGVAHDVNNSLTAIGGFASLIGDRTDDPEVRELADEIRASVDRTAVMTRKLLAFSRRQALAPRVVDLGAVLRDLWPMVTQLMTEAVIVELDCGPSPHVLVDPAGVEQIVLNLAVNARDAMPGGGRLTVRCRTAMIDEDDADAPDALPAGRYAELVVRDTGTGMPESVRSRVFEPFFSTKGDAGTGLGLAIVHGLVTAAGGSIEVTSAPDQGTSFRILLPEATSKADVGTPHTDAGPTPAAARHVLLAEDEPTIRRMAQIVLERAGHRVTSAADGELALAALDAARGDDRFDIVITDVVMPGMSGIELARRIREHHPDLPIVFTSGYDQGLLPTEGPFAGARLLEKPYSPAVLVATVREALG